MAAGTPEGKDFYGRRKATVETVFGINRRRKRLAGTTEQLARLWGRALRPDEDTFIVDSIPIPVAHIAREYATSICRKQFHTAPDKGLARR